MISLRGMFTIIGGDGQEYGPVTAQQLRAWIAAGRANLETQAKAVGSDEWRRVGDFPEFASGETSSVPPPLQSSAPTPVTGPVDAATFAADLISRARKLDVFSCLDRSFALWKSNFLPLVGTTLLVLFLQMLTNVIPLLGSIAGILLNGVFYGGLYYYYLGKMRGEPRTVGDVFEGFKRAFVPLMLSTVLTTLLSAVVVLLFCGPLFWALVQNAAVLKTAPASFNFPEITPLVGAGMFFGFVFLAYLSIGWIFTFALIIDHGLGAWTAMEVSRRVVTRQWFRVFFVAFLGGLLAMLGLIGLFIGVFLTLPLAFGALLYAYEDLCNPAPRAGAVATSEPFVG